MAIGRIPRNISPEAVTQILYVARQVDGPAIAGAEQRLRRGDHMNAGVRRLRRLPDGFIFARSSLKRNSRANQRQVILHPMRHLAHQQGLMLRRIIELVNSFAKRLGHRGNRQADDDEHNDEDEAGHTKGEIACRPHEEIGGDCGTE